MPHCAPSGYATDLLYWVISQWFRSLCLSCQKYLNRHFSRFKRQWDNLISCCLFVFMNSFFVLSKILLLLRWGLLHKWHHIWLNPALHCYKETLCQHLLSLMTRKKLKSPNRWRHLMHPIRTPCLDNHFSKKLDLIVWRFYYIGQVLEVNKVDKISKM